MVGIYSTMAKKAAVGKLAEFCVQFLRDLVIDMKFKTIKISQPEVGEENIFKPTKEVSRQLMKPETSRLYAQMMAVAGFVSELLLCEEKEAIFRSNDLY